MRVVLVLLIVAVAAVGVRANPSVESTAPNGRHGGVENVVGGSCFLRCNDICLPSHLYMLSDTPNEMFVQPMLKRWRPYDDFVRFDMDRKYGSFSRRLGHVATIDKPQDGAVVTVDLVNGDDFKIVKSFRTTLRVGRKGVGDSDVYAQIIGDSYTHGQFYRHALIASGAVPKFHLVGLLDSGGGQFNEGRGGWTLQSYFTVPTQSNRSYHGFMQPKNGRYWGSRGFWVMAWRCHRKTQPKGFEPTYSCSRFDACVSRFDEKTGILLNPQPGDIQYDDAAKSFVRYERECDGRDEARPSHGARPSHVEWKPVDASTLEWGFDYGKYLEMWRITPPQFLFVFLGLNDFINNLDADYAEWGRRIETVKESYLKACPGGKFVIGIPCSTCGSIDNDSGSFTPRQNAAMWRFRDWLIRTFDNREKDGFYLLDAGITVDNDNGYTKLPSGVQTGNPHPYRSYPAMGVPFAAFIQYHR